MSVRNVSSSPLSVKHNLVALRDFLGEKLRFISERISSVFKSRNDKDIEIYHLGGIKNLTFDPLNSGKKLDSKGYFYERISVKTSDGEIYTYGLHLKKYVDKWMIEVRNNKTEMNFQEWMETNSDKFREDIKKNSVRYFNDAERKQTEIHINENGTLVQIGLDSDKDESTHLLDGEYAFVVGNITDQNGEMKTKFYATPKIKTKNGLIQHSSFLRGSNVVSAGMLVVSNNGKNISIRNQSGHYKPSSKEMAYLVNHLKNSGFDISNIHVTCHKHKFFQFVSTFLKINIKWGLVSQNAEIWFENIGKHLIEKNGSSHK